MTRFGTDTHLVTPSCTGTRLLGELEPRSRAASEGFLRSSEGFLRSAGACAKVWLAMACNDRAEADGEGGTDVGRLLEADLSCCRLHGWAGRPTEPPLRRADSWLSAAWQGPTKGPGVGAVHTRLLLVERVGAGRHPEATHAAAMLGDGAVGALGQGSLQVSALA